MWKIELKVALHFLNNNNDSYTYTGYDNKQNTGRFNMS